MGLPRFISENGAICFESGMAIDIDGAPKSYHPNDGSGIKGLDFLSNAKDQDGKFVGVLCDDDGNPYVQGDSDPAPGYFISCTAYQDSTKEVTDPTRYVDATKVSYISVPPFLRKELGVRLGDLCMVYHKGHAVSAIVADVGPHSKAGEASPACAAALGIPSSPRNGGCDHGVRYVIFPGSKASFFDMNFQDHAKKLFADWGGQEKLEEVFSNV